MDVSVILGNLCNVGAVTADSVSGTRKKLNHILAFQIVSQAFYGAGAIFLRAYSGTVQNVVAILRNIAAIKRIKSRAVEWSLIAAGVIFGILFNNIGWVGLVAVAANLEYSLAVFTFKNNERALKVAFIVNMLMFFVFSYSIKNYVGAAGNIVASVTTLISLMKKTDIKKMETEDEIKGKATVHYKSWLSTYKGLIDDSYLEKLTLEKCESMARKFPENTLVSKHGKTVTGFICYGDCRDGDLSDAGEIIAIYLLPEYQGKGIGKKLMKAALKKLRKETVALWVLESNEKAIGFYERCGFVKDGTKREISLGAPVTEIRMITKGIDK